ncbi:MAG: hypothetical protein HC941_08800 [Microcoleus sp. SU_5_3]|nr:hypothetical protein [Microcoleus sp. SU_5_3]
MNQIPLLGGIFESIGILFTIWFAFRHLLWAENRQELAENMGSLAAEVVGNNTAIVLVEKQAIVQLNPSESAIVEMPEIPQAELIVVEQTIATIPEIPKAKLISVPPKSQTPTQIPATPDVAMANIGVDELRYLLITSEVELIESNAVIQELPYSFQSPELAIGVVKADGEKCDRCWNYSTHVGESIEHPLICERCVSAVDGKF